MKVKTLKLFKKSATRRFITPSVQQVWKAQLFKNLTVCNVR